MFELPKIRCVVVCLFYILLSYSAYSQEGGVIKGRITSANNPLEFARIYLKGSEYNTTSDLEGKFELKGLPAGTYTVIVSLVGYNTFEQTISIEAGEVKTLDVSIEVSIEELNQVVITGTLKEVSKLESPVPVEIYNPNFFKKNPTPNIYDAMQNVNGVRPQLNCQVCNTGDIHINGLEGPYTMVLIDGMPIVSSLSTVYGLMGIPNSMVERVEVVKGPASSLYGSEAVGGLINIITKNPTNAPIVSVDVMGTNWGEVNLDLSFKKNVSKSVSVLTGINYFNFQQKIDKNDDNFTDMTLQNRLSVFQKWNFKRAQNRLFSLAGRFMYEDRWGGELQWTPQFRGGDIIYGESIFTERWELIGAYQLPVKEKILFSFSFNDHKQNSVYGNTPYIADQKIAFSQFTWDKKVGKHDLLTGLAFRYIYYDDNTPGTANPDSINPQNQPQNTYLPGVFVQDEVSVATNHKLLIGLRYDHNNYHGSIFTPRLAYKWSPNKKNIIRFNTGTGFRVVNLFTEDHAALTGARSVEIRNELNPEKSYNVNLNFVKRIYTKENMFIGLDASAFYTYFNNRIVGDFETDPNKIIYDNLEGYAESKGLSLNLDVNFDNGLKFLVGVTVMENSLTEDGKTEQQLLTEKLAGTWAVSYKLKADWTLDYTGNLYSPMRLPVLGDTDPRSLNSPWFSIQNIQVTKSFNGGLQVYGGVKNFLNWTPNKDNDFIIARSHDPFDKNVQFDEAGEVVATADNPHALTFDPSYVYAPNQGARFFVGLRYNFNR